MAMELVDLRSVSDDETPTVDGIQFGSCAAMISSIPRQRERRQAIVEMLTALTRSLDRRHDISLMRGVFEQTLRRVVPVRTVQLREPGSRWGSRPEAASSPESVALEVLGADPGAVGMLEATFDPGCRLGEWDFQMLGIAAQLGALVLEIERSRLQLARAGLVYQQRARRDGAAPLIGSTPVMQTLRSTIERVAATDFTVLLEGESGVGQGARGPADPRAEPPPERSVRGDQLRRARRDAARGGAVRHRGSDGHRRPRPPRQVRGSRRRHAVPRRSVRSVARRPRPSCCARSRISRSSGSAATARIASTSGSSRRPTAACPSMVERRLFRPDLFYRLSGVDVRVPTLRERRPDVARAGAVLPGAPPLDAAAAAVGRRRRRARLLRLAGQRSRARAADRARGHAGRIRRPRARRPAAARSWRLRSGARSVAAAKRHAARVDEPLRAAGARSMSGQQAGSLPRARYQLSHPAGAISAFPGRRASRQQRRWWSHPNWSNRWCERDRGGWRRTRRASPVNSGNETGAAGCCEVARLPHGGPHHGPSADPRVVGA